MRRLIVLGLVALVSACQASVSAKANTSGDANASASADMKSNDTTTSTPPPAASNQTTTTAAPVNAAAPAASCPFQCFIADGANMTEVSADDLGRLRTAFTSTVEDMMKCANGYGRHRSSPVLNVRVNFNGEVTDVGVDARGYENVDTCVQGVQRPVPGGTFPGPATIRCAEKCERQPTVKSRMGKGKKNAATQAPAQDAQPQQNQMNP